MVPSGRFFTPLFYTKQLAYVSQVHVNAKSISREVAHFSSEPVRISSKPKSNFPVTASIARLWSTW